jgi:Arc/MetJ-type ribon-helix-helix transcriptional regulator
MARPKKPNKMISTSIQLPPGYVAEIRRLADYRGETMSDVIRQAVREYLTTEMVDSGRWRDGQ